MAVGIEFWLPEKVMGILTAALWLVSFRILASAYKNRKMWDVGYVPWVFISLGMISFALRELTHLFEHPLLAVLKPVFGMWSAFFLFCTVGYLFRVMYLRRRPVYSRTYLPFLFSLMPVAVLGYLRYSGSPLGYSADVMHGLEHMVWIFCGAVVIVQTYLLGSRAAGGFVRVYRFFQFAAYLAVTWNILAVVSPEGQFEEIFELLFGLFATLSVYTLDRMLRKLAAHIA